MQPREALLKYASKDDNDLQWTKGKSGLFVHCLSLLLLTTPPTTPAAWKESGNVFAAVSDEEEKEGDT